jgi:hypothetical protein
MTEKLYGGKKRRQTKKSSACVGLKKKNCIFPCKKVRKEKGKSEFGHCQTIFSKKKKYLAADTKKVIYDGIKKGKRSEKKAQRLRKKASETRKLEKSASKKADNLERKAGEEESKAQGFLQSVSTNLFGSSEEKAPEVQKEENPVVTEETPKEEDAVVAEAPKEDAVVAEAPKEDAVVTESTASVDDSTVENAEPEKEGIQMNMNENDSQNQEEKKEEI